MPTGDPITTTATANVWNTTSTGTTTDLTVGSVTYPTTPYTNGYWCNCGQWVQWGVGHVCVYPWHTNTIIYQGWNPVMTPQISKFKGNVKSIDDLPKNAATGDAYYVKDADVLVVREAQGWFHFDRD